MKKLSVEKINFENILYILMLLFYGCATKSYNIIVKEKVADDFYLGYSNDERKLYGLWQQRGYIYYGEKETDRDTLYYLNPPIPTHYACFESFVLKSTQRAKKSNFVIVKYEDSKLLMHYSTRDSLKYIKMRESLNIPDSIILKSIYD